MRMTMKVTKMRIKMIMTIISSIDIEGIRIVFVLYIFFMKDVLNIQNRNKSTSSNFYPYSIH